MSASSGTRDGHPTPGWGRCPPSPSRRAMPGATKTLRKPRCTVRAPSRPREYARIPIADLLCAPPPARAGRKPSLSDASDVTSASGSPRGVQAGARGRAPLPLPPPPSRPALLGPRALPPFAVAAEDGGAAAPLRYRDALAFLARVREAFRAEPVVHATLLEIVAGMGARALGAADASRSVRALFGPRRSFVIAFHYFMPLWRSAALML